MVYYEFLLKTQLGVDCAIGQKQSTAPVAKCNFCCYITRNNLRKDLLNTLLNQIQWSTKCKSDNMEEALQAVLKCHMSRFGVYCTYSKLKTDWNAALN